MARDFEDLHDLDDLDDGELRGLVREHLSAHNALDIDDLTVNVDNGLVILDGRVGTDGERLIAEHIVTDLIGAPRVRNRIFVDRRASRRRGSPRRPAVGRSPGAAESRSRGWRGGSQRRTVRDH
jgi:hypothetical protein